jgi:glycosyltransferase involved in cell wall biosynthesis
MTLEPRETEALLEPFLAQSAPLRSIVAVGCRQIIEITPSDLPQAPPDCAGNVAVLFRELDGQSGDTIHSLAEQVREQSWTTAGDDLLLLPADLLGERMPPVDRDFGFRAVAALFPQAADSNIGEISWRLRRSLFDRGLVCVGSVPIAGWKALCFLASDAIRSFDRLHAEPRGHVAMSVLVEGAGFANQLFRYCCVKLYALRYGLVPAFPEWPGNRLFGLRDQSCEGLSFRKISYPGFAKDDREFWDLDDPPIDIDLEGYFQEIPECWRKHRALLRNLFEAIPDYREVLDAWQRDVTDGGRRTLVAIHVRRGDYRDFQSKDIPWLRTVPEEWYLDWLRAIWPTLRDPVLFVGTDEPDTILPLFQQFEPVSATPGAGAHTLPDYLRDFEILGRADYLAICNSSYSHMAAILASSAQKCFIPSFQSQLFEPYEPWIDPAFWQRFEDAWSGPKWTGGHSLEPGRKPIAQGVSDAPIETATIFLDVSDLVLYLLHHTTLTGIQRVQGEILRNLPGAPHSEPIHFAVLSKRGGLFTIDASGLLNVIEGLCSAAISKAEVEYDLRALLDEAIPCALRPGDVFLSIGAFWNVAGMGLLLQNLKNSGVRVGVFIHDVIPIAAPEYFETHSTSIFVKAVYEALTFADFVLTTSAYNKACLAECMAGRFDPLPIHLVPLGHELSRPSPAESTISTKVADILERDYVLCVGTIEVRKNPAYLLNIWKVMVRSGRLDVPCLVFAGRQGWLVGDFLRQLEACNYLGGRIVVLHGATDVELDLLYQGCLLTMLPSFIEGWGLPVGESLAHGKICLCSATGGMPEAGGKLADYIDPYNVRDGIEKLSRYLDDPELRSRREREIAEQFHPRSWQEVADAVLESTHVLSRQARTMEGIAILLPADRYMPISSDPPALLMDEMDGRLSAELICSSGWRPPEVSGVRPAQPAATIRFRADLPDGSRINLVFRLAAFGRDFRLRIRSGSGAETDVSVSDGAEKMAVLTCAVEPGKLVTAELLSLGATLAGGAFSDADYWILKGILYFDPRRAVREASPTAALPIEAEDDTDRQQQTIVCPTEPAPRVQLRAAGWDDSRRAPTFGAFLQMKNSYWPWDFTADRKAPIFADDADRQAFHSGCGNSAQAPQTGSVNDAIRLFRHSDPFVSMSRFSEGSVFDRSRVWRAFGYLECSPASHTPWLSKQADGLWADEAALAAAPVYEGSYLIFYNGNLHNYYHWLVEGLLGLDVLTRAMGLDPSVKIALPKSMDINALLDHRESLEAIGLGGREIVEVGADLIRVREAIWIDSDLVQSMPKPYLQDFQQRIASLYAEVRPPRTRRLLVARKGPTRKIHNLELVQGYLSRYGFETVYLEGMSMRDQILLFQSADFIVSPHGAGLSNLLFCNPGTKVIELMPAVELRTFFWIISQKLDLVHGLQFCDTTGDSGFQSSIQVDIGKLHTLMRKFDL